MGLSLPREEFDQVVTEAIESLPADFRERLDNIVFQVENARKGHPNFMGLYHGVPFPGQSPVSATPQGFITLYQKTIQSQCRTKRDLVKLVRHVVAHEVSHHFGFSDDWLKANGLY